MEGFIDTAHIEWHTYPDLVVGVYNTVVFAEVYRPSRYRLLNKLRLTQQGLLLLEALNIYIVHTG